jgi:hypothetical protein
VVQIEPHEVRWHLAQMLPRLGLRAEERAEVVEILLGYLADESRIVETSSMQALADLAVGNAWLQEQVIPLLEKLTGTGSPAMRSRRQKLLPGFQAPLACSATHLPTKCRCVAPHARLTARPAA